MRLQDIANLIWTADTIDEALRAALGDLSNAYGVSLTLKDLDSEAETSYEAIDHNTLLVGAVANALRFRLVKRFDQTYPQRENPEGLANWATIQMNLFQSLLMQTRLRRFSESTDHPFSAWEWEEGKDFS
jgi:hypothetical protein